MPHTREQVIDLCHKAMEILYDQNTDFSDRETIQCYIPVEYLTSGQQGMLVSTMKWYETVISIK